MDMHQKERLIRCLRDTLDDLSRGPRPRYSGESNESWMTRIEAWWKTKSKFFAYAVKCLRSLDPKLADTYVDAYGQLKKVG